MSQVTDYTIPGSPLTMAQLQTQLQNLFAAAVSQNAGASAPENPFDGMPWVDTSGSPSWALKLYSAANGWREMATVNITTGAWEFSGLTKQSSPTDTTPGRLLINGAHGLGASTPGDAIADADDFTVIGWSRTDGSTLNLPSGANSLFGVLRNESRTTTSVRQTFMPVSSNEAVEVWARRLVDTTWGPWRPESGTAGHLLSFVTDETSAQTTRTAQSFASFFTINITPKLSNSRIVIEGSFTGAAYATDSVAALSADFAIFRGPIGDGINLGQRQINHRTANANVNIRHVSNVHLIGIDDSQGAGVQQDYRFALQAGPSTEARAVHTSTTAFFTAREIV